jgi:two-component system alkaline phosphatase synthesis response regulator PhoP
VVEVKVPVPERIEEVIEVPSLAGYRILVTDDEPDFLTFISTVLEDNGATVIKASNGDEAIRLAESEKPDLITLDLSMPGRSGIDVFETLRENQDTASIPVCIITGKPEMRKLIYDRHEEPPEGYVDKPVNEEGILLNIRKILKLAHHI